MAWKSYVQDEYDNRVHELIHSGVDRLIDLGSRLEAHSDVLATHEQDEDGKLTKLPDVPAEDLLIAQLGLDGAEEEIEITQEMVKILSRIMIIRNARTIINDSPLMEIG